MTKPLHDVREDKFGYGKGPKSDRIICLIDKDQFVRQAWQDDVAWEHIKAAFRDGHFPSVNRREHRGKKAHRVEFDNTSSGHSRYTCRTCNDATVVRERHMSDDAWRGRIEEFIQEHPCRRIHCMEGKHIFDTRSQL